MNEKIAEVFKEVEMYEGEEPYIFISYSHRDSSDMMEIARVFNHNNIRFWYDNGLHSGDDWNLVIAEHLERASVCLLLLSAAAASSQYVKNELSFAINHRIPIHTLLLERFVLPPDIEMMIGRFQMIEKTNGYKQRLVEALPSELYFSEDLKKSETKLNSHPLFVITDKVFDRQGTIFSLGHHETLGYEVLVQEDHITNENETDLYEQIRLVGRISHPLFPKIYDIVIHGNTMLTYQEYRREVFLDRYLSEHKLKEEEILSWIHTVIDAMEYLFSMNLGFRVFSRGSMVVCDGSRIGMFRLQNMYYGLIKLQMENRQFYFDNEVQEIGVLLYQLCTREIPVLPFPMIAAGDYSKPFIDKVNLVIQKCSKEKHRTGYNSFGEMKADLKLKRLRISDIAFLRTRQSKLKKYEEIKAANLDKVFTGGEISTRPASLEEEFGLEPTLTLADSLQTGEAIIKVLICSTGEAREFAQDEIVIGRSLECDMRLNQPTLSRIHAKLSRDTKGNYYVEDMGTSIGTYITEEGTDKRILPGQKIQINKKDVITVGGVKIQVL